METRQALQKMNAMDDAQWNTDGTAKLAAVRAIAGNNAITRDEIAAIAPDFTRDNPFIAEDTTRQDNTKALAELVAETRKALEGARVKLTMAQNEHDLLTKKLDHFMEEDARNNPQPSSVQTIQGYLARQRQDLREKAERIKRIQDSGVDLAAIAKLVK